MEILFKLPESALNAVDYVVVWIGFSAVVGLIASTLFFRRKSPPAPITILLGYVGTIAGWSMAKVYTSMTGSSPSGWKEQLLSPATFVIGIAGTAGLLFLFKIIAGQQAAQGGGGGGGGSGGSGDQGA